MIKMDYMNIPKSWNKYGLYHGYLSQSFTGKLDHEHIIPTDIDNLLCISVIIPQNNNITEQYNDNIVLW